MKPVQFAVSLTAALFLTLAAAQECTWEEEPNDKPHEATVVTDKGPDSAVPAPRRSGHTLCVAGELHGSDQDIFVWHVDEQQADLRWTIDLYGTPRVLTRLDLLQLDFLDNEIDVTARSDLLTVETMSASRVSSPELILEPGRYFLGFSKAGGNSDYLVHLRPGDPLSRGANGYRAGRSHDGIFSVHGSLSEEGAEQEWKLSDEDAGYIWNLNLATPITGTRTLELLAEDGTRIADLTTDSLGRAALNGLGLEAGTYTLRLQGDPGAFQLEAARDGRVGDGVALKPDDRRDQATHFPPGSTMRGTRTSSRDWFRIHIDDEAAATPWQLHADTEDTIRYFLENDDGEQLLNRQPRGGYTGVIENLSLEPGTYWLSLEGSRDADYELALKPGTLPEEGWEVEPNDGTAGATPLGPENQVRGNLSNWDRDVFSFSTEGDTWLYRLQLISQGNATITIRDSNGRQTASMKGNQRTRLDNITLPPGTHYVEVEGDEGEYALRLLPLGPAAEQASSEDVPATDEPLSAAAPAAEAQPLEEALEAPAEADLPALPPPPPGLPENEPNDDESRADRLFPGVPRVGTLPNTNDIDVYRFFLAEDQPVRIELVPPENGQPLRFDLSATGRYLPERDAEPGTPNVTEQWLTAGDHYVTVRNGETGDGWYQLRLTLLNGALPWNAEDNQPEPEDGPVTVGLATDEDSLAAFIPYGQEFTAIATLENTGRTARQVNLNAHVSDARVQLGLPDDIELGPGETARLPITITTPDDLRSDVPIQLSVAANTAAGSRGAQLSVPARCLALPVNPAWHWPVPEPLLGGIDVLWDGLGAAFHHEPDRGRPGPLIDGRATPALAPRLYSDDPPEFTLAGDEPIELLGALLHPLVGGATDRQLKDFRIETSTDGKTYTTAFEGELKGARIEQAFVFPEPVTATHVRLVPLSSQGGGNDFRLGEFKLVARETAPFGSLNLADPGVGGHIVWADPYTNRDFLHSERKEPYVNLGSAGEFQFVLGFHNGRAAQLERLEWAGDLDTRYEAFSGARVEVSMGGAAGPWEPLADWQFDRDADGRAVLSFTEPVWARYLRFTLDRTDEKQRNWALPKLLAAYEREAGDGYRSALGEWGMASRSGIYEQLHPPAIPEYESLHTGNGSRADAHPLASGETAEGTVLIGENDAWYRLEIEDGHNHLQLRLSGEPTISYAYEITDGAGEPVRTETRKNHDGVTISFFGRPGTYYLKLSEPKRNVIFSWDTSASMGPFLKLTYNALAAFAAAVDGEKESVQLLAYENPTPLWLLPYWSSDRELLQQTVNSFDRSASSSNSEKPMLLSAGALADREGERALLLITDAETTGSELSTAVWRALEEVPMRVFTFEVNSYGSLYSQQFMQDWAAANSGIYSLATTIGDLEMGHDRVSCVLDSPKHYRVEPLSSSVAEWEEASDWAVSELERAQELDLIPDALVGSDLTADITRAEFAGVAVRAYESLSGVETVPAEENPFTDTADPDVLKAFRADLAVGISDTEFEPDTLLNREQAAVILTRVVKKVSLPGWTWDEDADYELEFSQPEPFADDEAISPWARDSVYFMAANGIITGTGGNMFSPRALTPEQEAVNYAGATREQALVLAVRMVENLGGRE